MSLSSRKTLVLFAGSLALVAGAAPRSGAAPGAPAKRVADGKTSSFAPVAKLANLTRRRLHTFMYKPPSDEPVPKTVSVAGDFNDWSTTADPLKKNSHGVFTLRMKLPRGTHYYKFVLNGKQWIPDPTANKKYNQNDNYGGVNSGVYIGRSATGFPKPVPNAINTSAVRFNPASFRDLDVFSPKLVRVTLRTEANDADHVDVYIHETHGWKRETMRFTDKSAGFDRFGTVIRNDRPRARFYFGLRHGTQTLYLASRKFFQSPLPARAAAYVHTMHARFQTPAWSRHAVWYQIFPERFRNGDKANDPKGAVPWTAKWFSRQPGEKGTFYQYIYKRFYGGDVQGIIEKLSYLRRLGVNAIYLTPIFEAPSIHKYDTKDYRHVDDHFGYRGAIEKLKGETENPATWKWSKTDKLFLHFLAIAHQEGFHVVLDGVFNHCGRKFFAFQDVLKHGKKSKYAKWFDITHFGPPLRYVAWDKPNGALPIFRKDHSHGIVSGPRQFLLAIAKRWLAPNGNPADGIDGWRLDCAPNIPHAFWIRFREVVKATKPSAIIIGEIWSPAQAWLQGNQFDATMNYPFAMAATTFFCNKNQATTPSQFAKATNGLATMYRYQAELSEQNLLDSQDTDRFVSRFLNPDLPFNGADRLQDTNPHYNIQKPGPMDYRRMRQAVAFQMTFVGAPMIYYGDETGMWGASDPSNRQPMVWKDLQPYADPAVRFSERQFHFYQRAIAARRQLAPLSDGYYRPLTANGKSGVFAFARDIGHQHVYVILNRSAQACIATVHVAASDRGHALFNYLDPKELTLVVKRGPHARRPTLALLPGAKGYLAKNGTLSMTLGAYRSAILALPPAAK